MPTRLSLFSTLSYHLCIDLLLFFIVPYFWLKSAWIPSDFKCFETTSVRVILGLPPPFNTFNYHGLTLTNWCISMFAQNKINPSKPTVSQFILLMCYLHLLSNAIIFSLSNFVWPDMHLNIDNFLFYFKSVTPPCEYAGP